MNQNSVAPTHCFIEQGEPLFGHVRRVSRRMEHHDDHSAESDLFPQKLVELLKLEEAVVELNDQHIASAGRNRGSKIV
jgi:hypothetical protein